MRLSLVFYRRRYLAAWLGIFSMLMLFIVPVISQSLGHLGGQNLPVHCGSATSHYSGISEKHIINVGRNNQPHSESIPTAEHAACSYCLLLHHLPLLDIVSHIAVQLAPFIICRSSDLFVFLLIIKDIYPDVQPRAPPTSLF